MASILLCLYLNLLRTLLLHRRTFAGFVLYSVHTRFRFNPLKWNSLVRRLQYRFGFTFYHRIKAEWMRTTIFGIHTYYIARCQRDGVAKSNIKFKRVWSFTFLRINIGILKWLMFITKHYWSQCEILKSDSKKFDLFFPMNARHGRINERLCCTANRALYPSVLKWKQQEWQQTGK